MFVIKKFWEDPYLTELDAKVTSVDGDHVTVDQTIAFAFSGGQESDTGTIGGYKILKAEKRDQQIVYQLEGHNLSVEDAVLIKIDWERRYRLMRLHFAAEIVLELVTQRFNHPEKIGAHISEDKARVDFYWQGNISQIFDSLQTEIETLVKSNLPIRSDFSDTLNEVRFWEIEGFAKVPCGGTHPKRTGEVGKLLLKRNNIGKGKERIEIYLK
ncbi:MAG: alanyl-tRNA editing protein [Sporomusaceae bacterium]|nr:alanyl-tRNA editing protein [Sporomusaceae bacterium]